MKIIAAILNISAAVILSLFMIISLVFTYTGEVADKEISRAIIGGSDGPTAVFISRPCIPILVFTVLLTSLLFYNGFLIWKTK